MTAPLDFPDNIVYELKAACARVDGIRSVVGRYLRPEDPSRTAGVYSVIWTPGERHIGWPPEPLDGVYEIGIQLLVKHMNEEQARALHSNLTKKIRTMVYRDEELQLRLPQLRVTDTAAGVTESVQKWNVPKQTFLSNEMDGTFLFLSVTEVDVTAEIT